MMQRFSFYFLIGAMTPAFMPLTACDLYEEPLVTDKRIEVQQEQFSEQVSVSEADDQYLAGLAENFSRGDSESMQISVTYDPRGTASPPVRANNELLRIKNTLMKKGVQNIAANSLPVQGQGNEMNLLVTYDEYVALPPKDCKTMDGFENRALTLDSSYKQGCTVETVFSRQVAHPKDLAGDRELPESTEGRRAANIGERYRSGVANQPLEGESASGN
ncbi:MAG: CpaD family pilus assembly lipoprotein [Alphaproteobacteria bacterium]